MGIIPNNLQWKFLPQGKGLLVNEGETEVIGTFHAEGKMDRRRKHSIRSMIENAEIAHHYLQRFIDSARGPRGEIANPEMEDLVNRAQWLLTEAGK